MGKQDGSIIVGHDAVYVLPSETMYIWTFLDLCNLEWYVIDSSNSND